SGAARRSMAGLTGRGQGRAPFRSNRAPPAGQARIQSTAMTLPLADRVVALAEHRQLEEVASLLGNEGATILRCPLVEILDATDPAPVVAWLRDLMADRFAYVVLMTGEGVRRLLGAAERAGLREECIAALGR